MVQEIGSELWLPIYLLPDDQIIDTVEGPERDGLESWKKRDSPEPFAGSDPPDAPLSPLTTARASAADLGG